MDYNKLAQEFVRFYYSTFDADRTQVIGAYAPNAMLSFEGDCRQGAEAILDKLKNLQFQKVRHEVTSTDAQPTPQGGVLITVTGMIWPDAESTSFRFAQIFHLVASGSNFVVINDFFRLLF